MKFVFKSEFEAAVSWAEQNRNLSEVKERMAFIYALSGQSETVYYLGRTHTGMGQCGPFRPNVAVPFIYLYMVETLRQWLKVRAKPVAMVHSHPKPPEGMTCRHHSREDQLLVKLPGINAVYVVPFENNEVSRWP